MLRQEHHETLAGPVIIMGRRLVESRASSRFPGPHTYFSPRDMTVERFLSTRFPQVLITFGESGYCVSSPMDTDRPDKPPKNPLRTRSEVCRLAVSDLYCNNTTLGDSEFDLIDITGQQMDTSCVWAIVAPSSW